MAAPELLSTSLMSCSRSKSEQLDITKNPLPGRIVYTEKTDESIGFNENFDDLYIRLRFEQHPALFQMLMDAGKMKKADPDTLAVLYLSPISLFIGMCDRDQEQVMRLIENHVREFNRNYRI